MKLEGLLTTMRSFVGITEHPLGSNRTKIGEEFGWNGVPWCAETDSVACARNGFPLHEAAVINIEKLAKAGWNGMRWTRTPTLGAAVCFDFGGRGRPVDMHTGIVIEVFNSTQFRTIEGNHRDRCEVVIRDMKYVRGFATFPFEKSAMPPFNPNSGQFSLYPLAKNKPVVKRGSHGDAVKYLQGVLKFKTMVGLTVDGDFGPATERRVIDIQRFFKRPVDGVVGPQTWEVVDFLALRH